MAGSNGSRRNFLKIGAGVVGGVVVGAVGAVAYESSVIGSNNSSSSSTVASLQDQLTATQSQLNQTVGSLSAANSTIANLNSQLSTTQGALSSAQGALSNAQGSLSAANAQNTTLSSQNSTLSAQNSSLSQQLTATQGSLSSANSQVTSLQGALNTANANSAALQIQVDTTTAFQTLGVGEQSLLEAIGETIIPSDSNGPGFKEAAGIYFIDRVLAGDYGKNANMYMQGPFILSGQTNSVTVGGVGYPNGTPIQRVNAGTRYQYQMSIREFFRYGLQALQTYATSAYGGKFETLSAANQLTVLQDVWNNKPTTFNHILPQDFAYELTMLVWCGFLMDPMYGGNKNMVGWKYVAFNGVNTGNFYGEGLTPQKLMVATTPTRLQPASLGQYQKGSP